MLRVHSNRGYLINQEIKPRPTTGRQHILERTLSRALESLQGVGVNTENQILSTIARGIVEALGAGRAMIYLLDKEGKIEASEGYRMSRDESHNKGQDPTGIMKIAVDQKIPIYVEDLQHKNALKLKFKSEFLLNPEIVKKNLERFRNNFKSKREKMDLAVVPLIVGDDVIGLIRVDSWNQGRSVLRKSMAPVNLLATIQIFAFITALAIKIDRLVRQLEQDRENVSRDNIETRTYFQTLIHDIKNQLVAPVGYLDLLSRENPLSPEVSNNYINRTRESLRRTLTLTHDTLDSIHSRGKMSLRDIHMALFDLNDLIFYEAKDFGNINFVLQGIQLRSDQRRVAIVLRELLANARKYSTPESEITVKSEIVEKGITGKYVLISVIDKGIGFEKENEDKIFKGVRLSQSVARGHGLGLKNMRTLVILLGGQIGAESAGPGQGSTFWFTLPLTD
jgi:signal transduction histidine kinase